MRRYVWLAAAAVAILLVSVLIGLGGAAKSRASTGTIAFSVPAPVDPTHAFGEPSIGVDPVGGEVFTSGPTGTGTQRSLWEGSVDGGTTFRPITPHAPPTAAQSTEDPPGGGDTDINFDRSGKTYFADLYALACLRAAVTSDGGATVAENDDACGTSPAADRQWLAVYDPPPGTPNSSRYTGAKPLVYLEFNNLNTGAQWNKSNDGLNYSNALAGAAPGSQLSYAPFGADGYPAIDQQSGKVFQAAGAQDADGKTYDLLLNIGTPDAAGDLTFLDAPTSPGGAADPTKLIHIADKLPGSPDTLFTVLSMDSARNLFVTYAISGATPDQDQVYVSAASASTNWTKWTAPVRVSDGSTALGDAVNVFPWIKAGGAGRADAVWYGSDKNVDPSSQNGQRWNVFMNQLVFPVDSSGAITGKPPQTTLVKVTPHPMHYNDICLQGTGCISSQGNRNLADFFSVTIDRTGAAEIVYDDTSNGLAQPGFTPAGNQTVDHAGAPITTVIRQSSGMGLYGQPVTGPSDAPAGGITDPEGDARYPVLGGTNVPGMDIVSSSLSLSRDAHTLTVTDGIVDLSNPSATAAKVTATQELQYITRWQMGDTIYYAGMSLSPSGSPAYYAGQAQSVDLCSVSACDPHIIVYPESGSGGSAEGGKLTCPAKPSASDPCTITIQVNAADVGRPTSSSLLEEVGTYALAAAHPEGGTTNAQAQADNVPLEIDGACCFNFRQSAQEVLSNPLPPTAVAAPAHPPKPKSAPHKPSRRRKPAAGRHRTHKRHHPARRRQHRAHPRRDPDHDGDHDAPPSP